jgi:hypothetical protein
MKEGRFRILNFVFGRRGHEVEAGTGAALRESFPMESEADADMQRCIDLLDQVEFTIRERGEKP